MWSAGGEQVEAAVAGAVATLRTAVDRDWTAVPAGGLAWDCRRTAEHIADDLLTYAGRLAARVTDDAYVPFDTRLETDNAGLLHVIETTGALLAATVRTTPRDVRAYHPYPFRAANRDGFAAMGVAEVLLHTHDMAKGLGVRYEPSADLCTYVLTRIFPQVRPAADPWRTLLWATGRGELPGRVPVDGWQWCNNLAVPAERLVLDGITPAAATDLALGGDGGFRWAGGGPVDGTREGAAMVVKAYEAGVHRPEWGMFALVRRADGLAVGAMGCHGVPDEEGRVEVGYDLVPAARGHGYATEALRVLAGWALDRPEVTCVFATVEPGNHASRAVLERAGFSEVPTDGRLLAYELRPSRG